jgi:hypothetical protein
VHFNPVKQPRVRCGDVITKSVRLDADVVCPDGTPFAVKIAADHVTLDLAGHEIVNGRTDDGETVAVSTEGSVEDLEIRNGTISSGDQAVKLQASRSELEDLDIGGHVLGLSVIGDRNEFDDLQVRSAFHSIFIQGNRIEFEHSTVTSHPTEQLGSIEGDDNEIERSTFQCGTSGLTVEGDDVDVERNIGRQCPIFVVGTGSRIDRNEVFDSADVGIGVIDPKAKVTRNVATGNSDNGIQLFEPGAYVARNTANRNSEWGIRGVAGTIDGGRNRATGNGQPAQCVNVACRP